jgi:hypothetical protein
MKCRYVLSQLDTYLSREIPPAVRHQLQTHLAQCPYCRQELDELDALQRLIRNSLRRLAGRAFSGNDAWERIQESIHSGSFSMINQPTSLEATHPDWHPLQFSSNWAGFCLPRGAWW